MDLSPTSSPIKPPRTIKFGSPNRGYCYIPYTPGLDEKSRIENELTNEIYDHIISSDLFSSIGLSSDSSKSEIYSFISKHFSSLPSRYCLDQKAEDIIRHMTLLNTSLRNDQALVSCHSGKVDNFQQSAIPNTVWITVVCRDRPKIFNRIIFALDKFILSTLDADIMTTTTGKVFDRILVQVLPEYITNLPQLEMDITRELEYIFSIPQEYQFSITIVPPISSEESRMKNENDSNTSLEI